MCISLIYTAWVYNEGTCLKILSIWIVRMLFGNPWHIQTEKTWSPAVILGHIKISARYVFHKTAPSWRGHLWITHLRLPSIMCRPATQSPLKDRRRKTPSFIASPCNNKCCIETFGASSTPTALSTYTKNGDRLRPHYRPVCLLIDDSPAAHTVLFLNYLFIRCVRKTAKTDC